MNWRVRQGDALTLLREISVESVQTCITSPPYWGLRDYGTAKWEGGDLECDHAPEKRGTASSRDCPCGARRIDEQLGLERTPEEYVSRLVEAFREVRRVLRDDGTLWLNLGDSYANDTKWGGSSGGIMAHGLHGQTSVGRERRATGLKPKDLVGIPWRVAFALQADGWYLRSDIIWAKPNPMPESVTDRPTKAHEYLFLLAKSERYVYDREAITEEAVGPAGGIIRPLKSFLHDSIKHRTKAGLPACQERARQNGGFKNRNKRSIWTITTQPFPEAHFAVMPEALVEPCVLAGSKPGDLVLDPFAGSGTVGVVALRHGRHFLGLELNPAYCEMARCRIAGPLFAQEGVQ